MDPAKLKVIELRAELSQRGLDTKGNKPVLVERLRKALEDESKNPPTEKIPMDSEDSSDIGQKEISDKVNESTRSLPPRTPGRSSRSSSMSLSTPSKMSTRNAPKTAASPISMKQLSPSKPQNVEKTAEALPTISESPSEKAVVTEEDQSLPTSDREQSNEVVPSEPVQSEAHNLVSTKPSNEVEQQEAVENDRKSEAEESNTATVPTPELSEKKVDEDLALPSEKTESEPENSMSPTADEEEKTIEALNESQEKDYNDKKSVDTSEDNDNMDYNDDDDNALAEKHNATEVDQDMHDNEEEVDTKNTESAESINEVQKNEDIPKEEQEEKMTDITSEDTKQLANDEPIQDEQMTSEIEEKEFAEEDNVDTHKENEEDTHKEEEKDVEMTEVKEEETKLDIVDSVNKNVHDRKRKRSPSPAEDRVKSPEVKQPEEEPEIDYSTMVLSWYDSDLNLTIDRNNFLSATPLHNDGFCYAWAGARASHGFVQGKVYYEAKITEECSINVQNEEHPHLLRVGWSVSHASLQLGEEKLSYGFDGTGKKVTENEFTDYGAAFGKDDAVGCYLDMTSESNVTISYTLNGKNLGVAFTISKEELADKALFPHILSKNCSYSCNFGQEDPWSEETLEEYVPVGAVKPEDRVSGPQRPEKKEDCEIILMCGLPAAGKTCWAIKHASEHPEKMYNILGTQSLLEKMTVMGSSRKQQYPDKWDELVNKCTLAVNKLQEIAINRRRNYILDQTNVHLPTQRRKMKNFSGYQRKAVVVVPSDEEFKSRTVKRETADGKQFSDVSIMEMKANFSIPVVGEYFDAVEWVELNEEEGKKVIEMYNKAGKDAGFGQQPSKRPRFDRADSNRDNRDSREARSNRDNRESRDSRDHRDRRPNYPDRNRNPPWRGGSNVGWRDRQRGGHMRHVGSGYGPGWRGGRSGPVPPPPHRNDRRGGGSGGGGGGNNDRRTGGDRNRSVSSRQGGSWGPMNSNYQGSQSSGWGQGGNWSGGGQSSWSSQGGWGQQSQQWGGGSWKGYGQGSYGQSNYNQGYGNGNWNNSWNQQYYNQYWGQQQQSGQTTTPTTAAGGQAVSTTDSTMASSDNSEAPYNYSQGWQEYNAQSYSYPSAATSGQQSQQRK